MTPAKWSEADIAVLREPISNRDAGRRIGRSERACEAKRARLNIPSKPATVCSSGERDQVKTDFKGDSAVLESRSARIKTPDQLLAECEVDSSVWTIERVQVNKWEVGRKDKQVDITWAEGLATGSVHDSGRVFVEPLFQVKVWLVKRIPDAAQSARDEFAALLNDLRAVRPVRINRRKPARAGMLLEVAIPDLHIGKYAWKQETGVADYDLSIAKECHNLALLSLIERATRFNVSEVVYALGNDFYNVDQDDKTTTRGTRQDEDGRFQKSFRVGVDLAAEAVATLRQIAPVKVVLVPGNHDFQRSFYAGEVLSARFHKTDGVQIDNSPATRAYHRFGKVLIGWTHGHLEKPIALPQIMAQEQKEEWAKSAFREWHLGHIHHAETKLFQPLAEIDGVRLRYIPSLSPADSWHAQMGYLSLRSAEAFLWDKETGMHSNFSYTPPS